MKKLFLLSLITFAILFAKVPLTAETLCYTAGFESNDTSKYASRSLVNSALEIEHVMEFSKLPLVVQVRFKASSKNGYKVIVAHETKRSPRHWEIYTQPTTGFLRVYAPGFSKEELTAKTDVTDNTWHEAAFVLDGKTALLYLDGKLSDSMPVTVNTQPAAGQPLRIGALVENGLDFGGEISELRIAGATKPASAPWPTDASALAHWRFADKDSDLIDLTAHKRKLSLLSSFFEMRTPSPQPYLKEAIALYNDYAELASQVSTFAQQSGLVSIDWTTLHAGVWHLWQWEYEHYGKFDYAELRSLASPPEAEWQKRAADEAFDRHAVIWPEDGDIAGTTLRRTQALLDHLNKMTPNTKLANYALDLEKLRRSWNRVSDKTDTSKQNHYYALCALRRQIAFANPLLDFDDVLVAARGTFEGSARSLPLTNDAVGGHMANQYFGFNTIPAGGLYVFKNWRGAPQVRDLLQDAVVENGRMQGKKLNNGSVATPDLSFDGKKIAFAWSGNQAHNLNRYALDNTFHIFTINADGTGLRQLTDGTEGDFDPCFLPNRRIAFISERRGGHIRCFDANLRVRNYTLFSMKDDGSDIIPISYFETSEWNPSVNNDGMLVYSRWDYVDRENCIGGRFWIAGPDGSNPLAPHGNYPRPFSTIGAPETIRAEFEQQYPNIPFSGLGSRWGAPLVQMGIRAIPGSHRYVFTAAPHHGQVYGSLAILDLREKDDGHVSQVRRLTPDEPFPETEIRMRNHHKYGTPWPLSEDFYLANLWEDVVLLDRFGNREFLCGVRELPCFPDEKLRLVDPIVLRARKTPPNIPSRTYQGENASPSAPKATISVANVYDTDIPLPEGIKIKWLRVVQNILKTNHTMGVPMIGHEAENTPRIPLGIVPVEDDGSVFFEAPVAKELIFQLLDDDYRAVHSMRAVAFVFPGEQLSCMGCHAPDGRAPATAATPRALRRAPSKLQPELSPIEPISYYRQINPIVQNTCLPCHSQNGKGSRNLSYESFRNDNIWFSGGMFAQMVGPYSGEHGGSRTIPGTFGANSSKVVSALMTRHRERVDEATRHAIITWLDCNAPRLGAFEREAEQLQGKLVWPALDVDPANPQGVEGTFPALKRNFWHENNYGPYAFLGGSHLFNKVYLMNGNGEIVWDYPALSPQDVWMLPNGNVLFASLHAVREVTPLKQIVWEYTVEAPNEIPTCQPLPDGNILVGIVGECRLLELDRSGKIVREVKLQTVVARPHQQFRFCRKTSEGTYLVPFTDEGIVREYNTQGEIIRNFPRMSMPVGAIRLPGGHTLITANGTVTEYDVSNKIVWQLNTAFDIPDIAIGIPAGVQRLPNGNTVVCNWLSAPQEGKINAHIFELTPDKRVVWKVVTDRLGAVANCQLLTDDLKPRLPLDYK